MDPATLNDVGTTGMRLLILVLLVGVGVLVVLGVWMLRKGRRVPGEHVFVASRMTQGNRIFPAQVVITPSSITLVRPKWIGKMEESIHLAHVASIKINTRVLYSDVVIESSGGQDPVICHGHTKSDAIEMKQLIEGFQSQYYKASAKPQ